MTPLGEALMEQNRELIEAAAGVEAVNDKATPRVFRSRLKDTADKIHDTDCRARAANVRRGLAKLPKRKRAR